MAQRLVTEPRPITHQWQLLAAPRPQPRHGCLQLCSFELTQLEPFMSAFLQSKRIANNVCVLVICLLSVCSVLAVCLQPACHLLAAACSKQLTSKLQADRKQTASTLQTLSKQMESTQTLLAIHLLFNQHSSSPSNRACAPSRTWRTCARPSRCGTSS